MKIARLNRFDIIFSFTLEDVLMNYLSIVWCVLVSCAPHVRFLLFLFARCSVSLVSYLELNSTKTNFTEMALEGRGLD